MLELKDQLTNYLYFDGIRDDRRRAGPQYLKITKVRRKVVWG
jgi:hypothetical protein